ncbi:MAG: helix-turn-helix domain-containing protein [Candidatus Limnocylindrales bacterium]
MTTRDQASRRAAQARADAAGAAAATPGAKTTAAGISARALGAHTSLPERLLTAREQKGVDLFRAERDTKIRARYLAALERGDYRELPGAVYTRGFLRNYAQYLGLDPDEILVQWRRERGDGSADPVLVVPRTVSAPRQGITISPRVFGGLLLAVVVIAVVAYIGNQLLRYNQPPTISVTDPASAVITVDDAVSSYAIRGSSSPGATISMTIPGRDQPVQVTADANGNWTVDVQLRRGRNEFSVTATDPDTGNHAVAPYALVINVPISTIVTPALTLDQPADGATFENGAILVQGSATNATQVQVSAAYSGPDTSPSGTKATPAPTPAPPPAQSASVGSDGTFSVPFTLTAGKWTLTVAAVGSDSKTTSLTRAVTVAFKGVNLVVAIKGGSAWLKVWEDGIVDQTIGAGGKTYNDGNVLTFTAKSTIEVRTGKSSVTYFTLNGRSLGSLGAAANPETWLFAPPAPPRKTNRT